MTIDPAVKKKAIDLHLSGVGRNEIARILNSQKTRISKATITHLIQDRKRHQQKQEEYNNSGPSSSTSNPEVITSQPQSQQSWQPQQQQQPPRSPQPQVFQGPPSDASISTGIDMNNTGSPSLIARPGVGQANIETNFVTVKRNGGPLSYFLGENEDTTVNSNLCRNTAATASIITNKSVMSSSYDDVISVKMNEDSPSSRILSIPPESEAEPEEPESSIGDFRIPDPEMQIDKPDTNYVNSSSSRYVNPQTPTIKEARKIAEAASKNQEYASRMDDLRDSREEGEEPVVMESSSSDAVVDWDLDEAWRTRFLKTILEERRQRSEELALIEREKCALDEQRYSIEEYRKQIEQSIHNLDSASYNLEIREQKLLEVEPFLAMARQLRDMSLGFEELIPWFASIQEKSTLEKIDLKSAAHGIAQSLRAFRNLETLQKAIEQAKQQLVVLNTFTAQKERVVISLMNLENAGVRESEIIDLINIVRWNRQYDAGTRHGNGSGKLDDKLNL